MDFITGSREHLPDNPCLLTFDDGYKDHIEYVFPELKKRGLQGSFFPPARPIVDATLLDVNAIHFILACCDDTTALVNALKSACEQRGFSKADVEVLWERFGKANRFDSAEVIFVKRVLQRGLPEHLRHEIVNELFERFVGRSEGEFCSELYMSAEDLRHLVKEGMYVGSHTYSHSWLSSLTKDQQKKEIDHSIEFLDHIGSNTSKWIMCYPYGDYNDETLDILSATSCVAGLTTNFGDADLVAENPLTLSRWDTNDFPN